MDALARKDPTFSYNKRSNFVSFEDTDYKRIFRRAMWIKETLAKNGVKLYFTEGKFGCKDASSDTLAKYERYLEQHSKKRR